MQQSPVHARRRLVRPSTAPAKEVEELLPAQMAPNLSLGPSFLFPPAPSADPPPKGPLPSPHDFILQTSRAHPPDSDWSTFTTAYALGRWDPHRTPNPPRPVHNFIRNIHCRQPPFSEPSSATPPPPQSPSESIPDQPASANTPSFRPIMLSVLPDLLDVPASSSSSSKLSVSLGLPNTMTDLRPFSLPPSSNFAFPRSRNSFSNSPVSTPTTDTAVPLHSNSEITEVQTTVATLRWAAARVDISPLALPSPEHELTDPMRGITAAIPGSHLEIDTQPDYPTTPCGSRKSRLGSFWEGTTDVDEEGTALGQSRLAPMLRTPPDMVDGLSTFDRLPLFDLLHPPSAYHDTGEYSEKLSVSPQQESFCGGAPDSTYQSDSSKPPSPPPPPPPPLQVVQRPASEPATLDAPRRTHLLRQSSSPLPSSIPYEIRLPGGKVISDGPASGKTGRLVREERMYAELGYFAAPYPPDEFERRRALYK